MDLDELSIDFHEAMRDARAGCLVKPVLRSFLEAGQELYWPEMSRRSFGDRPPDGYFHPSTHPLWTKRALYEYLVHPESLIPERRTYENVLSLAVGTAMHSFIQWCLTTAGALPPALQVCRMGCSRCSEPSWVDDVVGERGHADGVLDGLTPQPVLWEFKTSSDRRLSALEELDFEAFAHTWPDYVEQAWSYQRLSGHRMTVVLVMALGFPWKMREFHIPYDERRSDRTRDKYLAVRQAIADQRPLICDCNRTQRSKCPARGLCSL